MKRILVTTDHSAESQVAFALTKSLSEKFDSKIDLLTVIEDPAQAAVIYALDNPIVPTKDVQEQFKEKVMRDLHALASEHLTDREVTCHVVLAEHAVHSAILSFVREHNIDLVVMASHGRTGLKRLLIGSVVERVVRECPCPILTVPSHGD